MKETTCCFTGHRVIRKKYIPQLKEAVRENITKLINCGITDFIAGGAIGFDMLAEFEVIKLREDYPHIKLILAIPFRYQDYKWNDDEKIRYKIIKDCADEIVYVSEIEELRCYSKRNKYMVDRSSICICYLCKAQGGTASTEKYAKSKNLKIINVFDMVK